MSRSASGGVLGWMTLAAVLLSALPLGSNRPVSWLALSAVVLALFALRVASDIVRRRPSGRKGKAVLAPLAVWLVVVAWATAQTIPGAGAWAHPSWELVEGVAPGLFSVSADPSAGALLVPRLVAYACVFWLAARAADSAPRAWLMVKVIALFGALLATYALIAAALDYNPILEYAGASRHFVSGSFVNRNSFATFMAFAAFANLATFLNAQTADPAGSIREALRLSLENFLSRAWVFAAGFATCAVALAASQSRAGALAAIAGALVLLGAHRRAASSYASLGLGALLLAFAVSAAGSGVGARLFGTTEEELRFAVYPVVVEAAAERPWLGHGLGAFATAFRPYVTPQLAAAAGEWNLAHNSYLENVFELGLPAALMLFLALGIVLWRIVKGVRTRRRDRLLPCLGLAAGSTAALHAIFDFSLQIPAVAALFAFILGLAWSQSFSLRDPSGQSRAESGGEAARRSG